MDKNIVFVKTNKGESEVGGKAGALSGDLKRVLILVDDKSSLEELSKRTVPSLRAVLPEVLTQLVKDGYIRDKAKPFAEPQIAAPKIVTPVAEELDFTGIVGADKTKKGGEAVKVHAELEAAVEAAKTKARAEAEAKAEANAKLAAESAARNKIEAEMRAKQEALARAQAEAKAKQEAEARVRAEQAAAQVKMQLEAAAKAKAEADALARQQIEAAARAKQEAELRAKQEAEAARVKAEQEAARVKAELEAAAKAKAEAEAARIKAEQEAARIRAELEAAKAKAEAEAKALAEARARQEAEAARLKAEQEAARIRAEQEAAKAKAEAEAKALAELRAKQEEEASRIKAEQEAIRVKAEQDAARIKAEAELKAQTEERARKDAETARLKAEQEAAQAKAELEAVKAASARQEPAAHASGAQARPDAEEARLQAEQEAAAKRASQEEQLLAAAQAKAWAAAEQRAKEQAKLEAGRPAQAVVEPVKPASPQRGNVRRKPLPLGKLAAGLLVLALVSVVLLPYVMPLKGYIAPIEQKLSAQFKQPVHVGNLRAELFPWPRLQLEKVTVGSEQELKAEGVEVTFDLLSLFSEVKTVRNVELRDIALTGASFGKALSWLQGVGGNTAYPVQHVTVSRANVSTEVALPVFSGEIEIKEQGRIAKVALKSADGKIEMELHPEQDRWKMVLGVKESSLPVFPNVQFDDLTVKGEIAAAGANVEVKGQAYGGFLQGDAKLKWQQGWQLQGRVEAASVELSKAFPKFGVSGELGGNGNFSASANKLGALADTRQIEGVFTVKKGVVSGMDMVETARGNHQNGSTGRTHFDEMTGNFQANTRGQHFQQLKIESGILGAKGSFDVGAAAQLAGRFAVELKARGGSASLALSGTLTEPVLRSSR